MIMMDFMTVNVEVSSSIFQQASFYALDKSPEGPVAQFYYFSAKLYRCISNAVNALPPFSERSGDAELPISGERISIAAIKAEVEEMVRNHAKFSRDAALVPEDPTASYDIPDSVEVLNAGDISHMRSFDFVKCPEFESAVNYDDKVLFIGADASLPPDMDDFMELMASCVDGLELCC